MKIAPLVLAVALAGCGSQTSRQLEAIKTSRSVLNEWAWVEQRRAAGAVTSPYARSMADHARQQLRTAGEALQSRFPAEASLIDGLCSGSPDATALRGAAVRLKPIETSLEAA